MQRISFHNLQLDCGRTAEVRAAFLALPHEAGFHQVLTVNPEYVVLARHEPRLQALTQAASLVLLDGFGLQLALPKALHAQRYTGADAVHELLNEARLHGWRVGIVLTPNGLSTQAMVKHALATTYPNLNVRVWENGDAALNELRQQSVDIFLVTFGQPQQDFWIADHKIALQNVRLAMGVGGSVDFLTGARKRAPRAMRSLGLEWLWRLLTQPQRLPRMFRATFGFWYTLLTT